MTKPARPRGFRARRPFAALSLASFGAFGLFAGVLACGGGDAEGTAPVTTPTTPPPVATAPATDPAADAAAANQKKFADLRDRVTQFWLDDQPSSARALGFHEYDGKVEDVSQAGLDASRTKTQALRKELDGFDATTLSDDDALDLGLMKQTIDMTLFTLIERDAPHKSPQFYEPILNVSNYVEKSYASKEDRQKGLIAHEEAAVVQMGHFYENMKLPLSKVVATVGSKNYAGFASYLRGDTKKMFAAVGDVATQKRFLAANEALAKEADKAAAFLKKAALTGDDSHVLGKERFLKLLKAQEGLDISLADFKKQGEDNLAANKAAYEALLPKVKVKKPAAKDLLSIAGMIDKQSRQFLIDKNIVTLATQDDAEVRETPPYSRWNSASIEMSGPFDATRNAFYYITLPDPSWTKKAQEEYIMTYGTMWSTTVHEVYPGHFVQGRWIERAPSKVQKMTGSYSFIEGWAHYTEQMMMEQGFAPNLGVPPEKQHDAGMDLDAFHLGQLSDALLRNCRYVASIGIHTEGMTVEQATKRFMNDCHIDPANAKEQAIRGTFDPGYFAYTLGKLQILALRDEAKKAMGDKFTLQRFHDAILSHGSPPVALIHDRVLKDLTALK
jgi:hypothetical protein